jgi:hypothetical protein
VSQGPGIGYVVHGHYVKITIAHGGPIDQPADSSETVYANLHWHLFLLFQNVLTCSLQFTICRKVG